MLKALMSFIVLSTWSFCASAIVISDGSTSYNGTDVGQIDTLLGEISRREFRDFLRGTGLADFREASEELWANSLFDSDVDLAFAGVSRQVDYYTTDVADVYALMLPTEPGYYILKNANYWGLFENKNGSDWAVFDASILAARFWLGSGSFRVAHITSMENVSPVPVPASLPLMATALAAFVWFRRRRTQ